MRGFLDAVGDDLVVDLFVALDFVWIYPDVGCRTSPMFLEIDDVSGATVQVAVDENGNLWGVSATCAKIQSETGASIRSKM